MARCLEVDLLCTHHLVFQEVRDLAARLNVVLC
jgi:hypothetical protein